MLKVLGKIDEIDMNILKELINDASLSVPKLSKKINVNSSVVYSRIKRLTKRGFIKRFTVEVNEDLLGYNVTAIIGANLNSKYRKDAIDEVLGLESVREVTEVTGRFDVMISVRSKTLGELHDVIANKIALINGITHTETFVEMAQKRTEPKYVVRS